MWFLRNATRFCVHHWRTSKGAFVHSHAIGCCSEGVLNPQTLQKASVFVRCWNITGTLKNISKQRWVIWLLHCLPLWNIYPFEIFESAWNLLTVMSVKFCIPRILVSTAVSKLKTVLGTNCWEMKNFGTIYNKTELDHSHAFGVSFQNNCRYFASAGNHKCTLHFL